MKRIAQLFLALILICTHVLANDSISAGVDYGMDSNFTIPVVHKSVQDISLSYEELRAIYTLNITKWKNGQKIVVVTLPYNHPMQRRFLWEYLGMSPSRYSEIIDSQAAGGKTRPTVVRSDTMMIAKIISTPGAIGFIDNSLSNGVDLDGKLKQSKVYLK